jgi:hypothetical protein
MMEESQEDENWERRETRTEKKGWKVKKRQREC